MLCGDFCGKYQKYSKNLKTNGAIISDNIYFHGYVEQEERIENKNLRQLVDKVRVYIDFLNNNEEFDTKFYKVGDGISVSKFKIYE